MRAATDELVIEPGKGFGHYWSELWAYRELLCFLAWRDISVRYKQTAIGVAWSLLQPLLTMVVFTVVFGRLAGLPSGGAPYAILVFAALLPWQLFSSSLTESSGSLVANSQLISKVYFPRLAIPAGAVAVSLVDFLISFGILLGLMAAYRHAPGWRMLSLPFFALLACLAALGGGLWMASLNVRYRDFRYIVPFLVTAGLYLSPVGFSSDIVPGQWRFVYSLNPMVGVIDGFRWAIIGSAGFYWPGFLTSVVLVLVLFGTGLRHFRRTERTFADNI
jgi:lipopolysaccharide transport system permease protein